MSNLSDTGDRSRSRASYNAHASIKLGKHRVLKAVLRDISLDSAYLWCNPVLDVGQAVRIEITILGQDSELIVRTAGTVVRRDREGVAVAFNKPLEWWPVFVLFPLSRLDNMAASFFRAENRRRSEE